MEAVEECGNEKIDLLEFLDRVPARITGGDQYTWECYGEYARYLDLERNVGIIFDVNSHRIFEMTISEQSDVIHTWRNPVWEKGYLQEVRKRRNFTTRQANRLKSDTTIDDFIMLVIGLYERPEF